MSLVLRESLLKSEPARYSSPLLPPEGIVLCKGLGVFLSAVGKETSTLYFSGLVEGNRGPVPEGMARHPASFVFSVLHRGLCWKPVADSASSVLNTGDRG